MDHSDLIAELPRIEKLTAAERLKIAKERRINQLLRHEQYERELTKREKILSQRKQTGKARSLHFVHSVMLLEAAARNDIEEGEVSSDLLTFSIVKIYHITNYFELIC